MTVHQLIKKFLEKNKKYDYISFSDDVLTFSYKGHLDEYYISDITDPTEKNLMESLENKLLKAPRYELRLGKGCRITNLYNMSEILDSLKNELCMDEDSYIIELRSGKKFKVKLTVKLEKV